MGRGEGMSSFWMGEGDEGDFIAMMSMVAVQALRMTLAAPTATSVVVVGQPP